MRVPLIPGLVAFQLVLSPDTVADTLQLRDKASVTGRIIAEKPDSLFVDVGYTVITVPRAQVVEILKEDVDSPPGRSLQPGTGRADVDITPGAGSEAPGSMPMPRGMHWKRR